MRPACVVGGSGNVQVYHTDGSGSVRAVSDANGNVVQTYQTDEFGVPTQTQGSSGQPFEYTGQQRDGESGLYYLRARTFDPSTGRFFSRDPAFGLAGIPSSLNRYSYALNNPGTLIDPSGLSSNQVTRDGSSDNPCLSTARGLFVGHIVNAMCLDMPMGIGVVVAIVDTPPPPHVLTTVVFAKPPKGGSGKDRMRGSDAKAQEAERIRWLSQGMTPTQRDEFQRLIEDTKTYEGRGSDDNLGLKRLRELRDMVLRGEAH